MVSEIQQDLDNSQADMLAFMANDQASIHGATELSSLEIKEEYSETKGK